MGLVTASAHDFAEQVRDRRRQLGSRAAYQSLIAENDALTRMADLDTGGVLAQMRSTIHTILIGEWASERKAAYGYQRPFAVVALGGTGRGEMAPSSDIDIAFLFDDAIEGNLFLEDLQKRILHTDEFYTQHGFRFVPLPFNMDDMPGLDGKQLNSFLDLDPIVDPENLSRAFRERIRATFDPFEQFLHVRSFWKEQWEGATNRWEQISQFDIKNDGLRVFLAGIWTLGSKQFKHSHEVYAALEDPRDLSAYHFIMRIRAFLHLRNAGRRPRVAGVDHPEDMARFEDLTSFGEMLGPEASERDKFDFANEVRRRLLAARRRVGCFAKGIIEHELKEGRPVSAGNPIVYGTGGLFHQSGGRGGDPVEKSSAALSLLLAAQHYGVQIDPAELVATFRNAGDWLVPVPELAALFQEERPGLSKTFAFLAQVEGAEDRLFPGYAEFEASLDERVFSERKSLRSVLERAKLGTLEEFVVEGRAKVEKYGRPLAVPTQDVKVELEAAGLDENHLAAVKLALKTKRLPLTAEDLAAQNDATRPWHERFYSGFSRVALDQYYEPLLKAGFSADILDITRFLVAHRRAFKEYASSDPNDVNQVRAFVALCGTEQRLRALYVFTRADRDRWESATTEPDRWFLIHELYGKAMQTFRPPQDPARALAAAGFSSEQVQILQDLGADFHEGRYRLHANRFGEHLVRLAQDPTAEPLAKSFWDGFSPIIGVAARDYRGLAATISGALWQQEISLRQAHLFSARNYGLALDFFHLPGNKKPPESLPRLITEAIRQRRFIREEDESSLPALQGQLTLREWRPGQFCLRFDTEEDSSGLVYALAYRVFRYLEGAIFSLNAHATRGRAFVSVYFSPPEGMLLQQAQAIVDARFSRVRA